MDRIQLPEPMSGRRLVFIALVLEGFLFLLAIFLGIGYKNPVFEHLGNFTQGLVWGGLASIPPLLLFWISLRIRTGPLARLRDDVALLVNQMFADCSFLDLVWISFAAGIGEEFLFRGALQSILTDRTGILMALIISNLLFGLAHPISKIYFATAAFFGLYFGVLFILLDNLWVPIVAHALYDLVALSYYLKYSVK